MGSLAHITEIKRRCLISDRSDDGRYQPSEDWVATVGNEETYVNIQGSPLSDLIT